MRRRGETLILPVSPAFRRQPISGHSNKSPGAAKSSNFPSFPVDNERPLVRAALRGEVEKSGSRRPNTVFSSIKYGISLIQLSSHSK